MALSLHTPLHLLECARKNLEPRPVPFARFLLLVRLVHVGLISDGPDYFFLFEKIRCEFVPQLWDFAVGVASPLRERRAKAFLSVAAQ